MTREGGCLCGAVRFAVAGSLREILVCHCVECRRWTGRAWPATAVRLEELAVTGASDVRWLPSPESDVSAERGFCARCGTALFWRAPGSKHVSISAGTLDDPSRLPVAAHIWTEQSLEWDLPPDNVQVYPRGYPVEAPPVRWQ